MDYRVVGYGLILIVPTFNAPKSWAEYFLFKRNANAFSLDAVIDVGLRRHEMIF